MLHPAFCHPYTFWVQSRMAHTPSNKEESTTTEVTDNSCHGHDCVAECGIEGYCHAERGRHHNFSQGPIPGQDYAELRHPHNRWRV